MNKYLISKDSGQMQIPYEDYTLLMEKVNQVEHMRQVKASVVADLSGFLGGKSSVDAIAQKIEKAKATAPAPKPAPAPKAAPEEPKVSIEFAAAKPVKKEKPVEPIAPAKKTPAAARAMTEGVDVPPIKKDISIHFNKQDESGRLFSVFKQYYTCLNDTCGGTVRVTMKDGFCSLWNYDEWEEFAFIDVFEGNLRVAINPRYTDELKSLDFCEVPRLLSSRRNLVCVQIDDLNNTMLAVLVKAFEEVGLTAS